MWLRLPWSQRFLLWIFFLLNGYKFIYNEEEIPSEGETSGNNCLQPHFHAVKFWSSCSDWIIILITVYEIWLAESDIVWAEKRAGKGKKWMILFPVGPDWSIKNQNLTAWKWGCKQLLPEVSPSLGVSSSYIRHCIAIYNRWRETKSTRDQGRLRSNSVDNFRTDEWWHPSLTSKDLIWTCFVIGFLRQ